MLEHRPVVNGVLLLAGELLDETLEQLDAKGRRLLIEAPLPFEQRVADV